MLLIFFLIFCFRASTEALEFAMTKLTPFGKVQKYIEKLEVCFFFVSIFFFQKFPERLSGLHCNERDVYYCCRIFWRC